LAKAKTAREGCWQTAGGEAPHRSHRIQDTGPKGCRADMQLGNKRNHSGMGLGMGMGMGKAENVA